MFRWLTSWLGGGEKAPPDAGTPLDLEREAQELRLALQEREGQLARLQADLARLRQDEAGRLAEAVGREREALLAEAAGPVAQLLTQAHLEGEGKAVQVRDVLTVARRLVRLLEERGLELVGAVGEQADFDPNRHAVLAGEAPPPGKPVRVRFVGAACKGKVLRKAGVEVADAGTTGR